MPIPKEKRLFSNHHFSVAMFWGMYPPKSLTWNLESLYKWRVSSLYNWFFGVFVQLSLNSEGLIPIYLHENHKKSNKSRYTIHGSYGFFWELEAVCVFFVIQTGNFCIGFVGVNCLSPKWSVEKTSRGRKFLMYSPRWISNSTGTFFEHLSRWWFHLYLNKWSNLTNIFQTGWNHQLVY